jgi:hypothetical protein
MLSEDFASQQRSKTAVEASLPFPPPPRESQEIQAAPPFALFKRWESMPPARFVIAPHDPAGPVCA